MASLINPKCATPTFQMSSQDTAEDCGKLNGTITAIIFTIIISIITGAMFYNSGKYKDPDGIEQTKPKNWWILVIGASIIILVWIVLPISSRWLASRRYQGYQDRIKSMEAQGMTHKQALSKLQSWKEQEMRSEATEQAGSQIAGAIAGLDFNKK